MEISLVLGTIPQIINFVLVPTFSTWSDKTRSRFGRRKPFLIFSAPLLVLTTLMIGWYAEISAFVSGYFPSVPAENISLYVLATLFILFQVMILFPSSIIYYLVADVIPHTNSPSYIDHPVKKREV